MAVRVNPSQYNYRVLDAIRAMEAECVRPTINRIRDATGLGRITVIYARFALIDAGLWAKPKSVHYEPTIDDGVTTIPDDPDAAEIQARIAEARAAKRARRESGRCDEPDSDSEAA